MLELLNAMRIQFGGDVLNEYEMVYYVIEPDFYFEYTDRMKKFGNILNTYWEGEQSVADAFVRKEVNRKFEVNDCSKRFFSTISRYSIK